MLDKRYKHKVRLTNPFCLYIKYPVSGIFYVKFPSGKSYSTRTTNPEEAYNFAINFSNSKNTEKLSKQILLDYYVQSSVWLSYDISHGSRYTERTIKQNHNAMAKVYDMLPDIRTVDNLTKKRLTKLQDQLLDSGISGKTVNNIMSVFHKIILQLVDKELIKEDPFIGLRKCSHTKKKRLCFPIKSFTGFYKDDMSNIQKLAYLAICTGARATELSYITPECLTECGDYYMLRIPGTKTEYSDRVVPVSDKIAKIILSPDYDRIICYYNKQYCAEIIGAQLGYSLEYIRENGICLHSFRKMYKTILTSANLNTTLIEMLMGHSTHNQESNNVERTYFVAESADLTDVYKSVIKSFEFLTNKG